MSEIIKSTKLERQLELINEVISYDMYNLGDQFFESIVIKLNEVLEADYTFVGKLSENKDKVETISMAGKNGLLDNMTYDLKYTPCENVVGKSVCTYSKNIRELFPEDKLLIDMEIEAYVGVPLFDSNKNPTGIIVCLYKNEIKDAYAIESILMIFASRASAELEHMKLYASLESHKVLLELKIADELSKNEKLIRTTSERDSFWKALNNSSLVSITDLKGNILYANEKFTEVSKYKSDELLGSNHNILNSGHHSKSFWIGMWKCLNMGKTWRNDVKNKAKDGSYYWVDTTINPVKDSTGKIINYMSVRSLITHKKTLEENREKLLNDFEDFAFIASHKVRGPLARMMGLVNLINEGMVTEEELDYSLKALSVASEEMDNVIREMVSSLSQNALIQLIKKRK